MSKTIVLQQECRTKMYTTEQSTDDDQKTHQFSSVWPLMPKYGESKDHAENRNPLSPPNQLSRTSSLDRIRQFPAYLCRRGSNSVLFWLYNSRSVFREVLASAHKQSRGVFLALCVYLAIGLIVAQLAICGLVMSIAAPTLPYGFIFMVACIAIMGALGMKTINHDKDVVLNSS